MQDRRMAMLPLLPPSPRGFSGCVDKIYFQMRPH